MAIEIKELLVKVVVDESPIKTNVVTVQKHQDVEQLKADIIKKCTREVLEKLKEQQER
ncbi:MAG: DUF5908 family protein [Bacteroidota bacterium]